MTRPKDQLRWAAWIAALVVLLGGRVALAQGTAVITGTVLDASTKRPIPDVVITATSPALQGEQLVVTDGGGNYRIPSLPPGEDYSVRAEKETYRVIARGGIRLTSGSTVRVNIELLPEAIQADKEILVEAKAPVLDVGSSRVATTITSDFTRRIAVNPPTGKGGASRSFESLAAAAPGTFVDTYGVSVNGTSSPENGFIIDGVSANDAAFGILSTPLSSEFVKEVNVITAGYLPEYGRSIGGIMDVVTKSGSNEFHGSFFSSITPGIFEGKRAVIPRAGNTITTDPRLTSIHDFGFELGGPILKDKLWFFTGFSVALQKSRLDRSLNKLLYQQNPDGTPVLDMDGKPIAIVDADTGFQRIDRLPGTQETYYATSRTMQYIGKLTWNINQDHNVSVSVFGVPSTSGGNGTYQLNPQSGLIAVNNLNGSFGALAGINDAFTNNVVIKSQSAFDNKKYLLDLTLGWVYNTLDQRAADGSGIDDVDDPRTLASVPAVNWRRSSGPGRHAITDFESLSRDALAACAPGGDLELAKIYCPVVTYNTGGAAVRRFSQNRYQGRAIFTALLNALGTHIVKAGVDFEMLTYENSRAPSGGNSLRESRNGAFFSDARRYGFLQGPDDPVFLKRFTTSNQSITVGGFVQDSWNILDRVTLNAGLRYDAQVVTGNDGRVGITLPNQWSPRLGVIWDPTREGRAKVFANFARFYQAITLNMVDRSFPGELNLTSTRAAATCDPTDPKQSRSGGGCDDKGNLVTQGAATDPNQKYAVVGADRVPVDPDIAPQSSNQLVVGGEYEVLENARLGAAYTHQNLDRVVEDMSRDEAQTYFIGNPGHGIARDFPEARRDYDSFMVYFQKSFARQWLATASYTVSYSRGNIAGLFRAETGQLDPNISSDFDLQSLLPNRTGPLPGDRTHSLKVFAAREFSLPGGVSVSVGGSYTGRSGTPISVLGSHPVYLAGEVFILPRGAYGRTPWVHSIDTNVTAGVALSKQSRLTLGVDIFNLFNFQAATGVDQNYTFADVRPIPEGSLSDLPKGKSPGKLVNYLDGTPFDPTDKNPNFGKPNAYQTPRQIRVNARITF